MTPHLLLTSPLYPYHEQQYPKMTSAFVPVAPSQPRPQGRRRYDATDIALLIEFSTMWMETEDAVAAANMNHSDPPVTITSAPAAEVPTPLQQESQGAPATTEAPEVVDLTMSDPIIMADQFQDNASVVSVESFECQDMETEQSAPVKGDTNQRETFLSTCWEIDSFMDTVQVGLA
ncbi:expressed unknown protein [Seminavis robusta]|uniref:Uncharacterized protein n=1 Tax=Seminavis robusta TaxID=568900 RepID=A0A9N8E976_9STRA|nr:expressed unknown protein [Seminavis robusta]|eukprot:Sro795_g203620.1 n/a (176) ;mRNA; f:43959-44636